MLKQRVIPTLLLKKHGLYKGKQFKDYKYVGDPINAVKIFNEKEVDELVIFDIDATNDGLEPDFEYLKNITMQAFMPLGYGGGINSVFQIEKIFNYGIEKAIINTAACTNLNLIKEASCIAGSQSIVVSIDIKINKDNEYTVYSHSGKVDTGLNPLEYALRIQDAGAGEIILCSIDREGTFSGIDLEITNLIAKNLVIPLVASGGAANLSDIRKAINIGASAVTAGSMFVFQGKYRAVLISYPKYNDLQTALR